MSVGNCAALKCVAQNSKRVILYGKILGLIFSDFDIIETLLFNHKVNRKKFKTNFFNTVIALWVIFTMTTAPSAFPIIPLPPSPNGCRKRAPEKSADPKNGNLSYRRRKTGQQLIIEWAKEMQMILDKYPENRSDYLLPVIRNPGINERCTHRNTGYNIKHNLKRISQTVGVTIPLTPLRCPS